VLEDLFDCCPNDGKMLAHIARPPFSKLRLEHLCECGRIAEGKSCYEALLALGITWAE
jgi:hypothetical protein